MQKNIFKKRTILIYLIIFLFTLILPSVTSAGYTWSDPTQTETQQEVAPVTPSGYTTSAAGDINQLNTQQQGDLPSVDQIRDYYPLAQLPGIGEENCAPDKSIPAKTVCVKTSSDSSKSTAFGDYLNAMIKLFIGLCAVLAMIMIVMGGIQYMTSELVSGKEAGRKRITNAIFGLIIALGSFAILNTINPDLVNINLGDLKKVTVTIVNLPDAGDGSVDPDFKNTETGGNYSTTSVSAGATSAVDKLNQGWEINYFKFYTNNRLLIALKKGDATDNSNLVSAMPGLNGFAEEGKGVTGDKKSPKGSWKILNVTIPEKGQPVYNQSGANMGATFWLLSPMTNGERGIGMHGNKSGVPNGTYGCIMLKNSDLLALLPYVKSGIPVYIGDN